MNGSPLLVTMVGAGHFASELTKNGVDRRH